MSNVAAKDLKPGMKIDLEADQYVMHPTTDPLTRSMAEMQYAEVDCVALLQGKRFVHFVEHDSLLVPADHLFKVVAPQQVYITADVINLDSEEEFHGWVDLRWNRFELRENKEDVRPHIYDPETDGTIREYVETLIGGIDSGSDGETFYAADSDMNHETGEYWRYAAHVEDIAD